MHKLHVDAIGSEKIEPVAYKYEIGNPKQATMSKNFIPICPFYSSVWGTFFQAYLVLSEDHTGQQEIYI